MRQPHPATLATIARLHAVRDRLLENLARDLAHLDAETLEHVQRLVSECFPPWRTEKRTEDGRPVVLRFARHKSRTNVRRQRP